MPLETAQFIDTLQPDWPTGTDPESMGDDHLRMVKQVLQNTFPKMNAACTMTAAKFNQFDAGFNFVAATTDPALPAHWQCVNADDSSKMAPLQINTIVGGGLTGSQQPYYALNWADVINSLYPNGTIHITTRAGNPATWLGFGTWVQRGGAVYGAGVSVTDGDGVAATVALGGIPGWWHPHASHLFAENLPLTIDEGGAHTHPFNYDGVNTNNGHYGDTGYGGTPVAKKGTTDSAGAHGHTGHLSVGGAGPFMTPGRGYYIWERTA